MKKQRLIVLTDIFHGFEVDDIQSMIRLLVYSNDIDIEGLIAITSCFVKHGGKEENARIIHGLIDAYEQVKVNLDRYSKDYPSSSYLHKQVCCGLPFFGGRFQNYPIKNEKNNPGVLKIIEALKKEEERPLWIALWGGANTLAQALSLLEKEDHTNFDSYLSKLRIYAISDQDHAGKWIRKHYGKKLFYIVSPSKGSWFGNYTYYKATWPGISSDNFKHGSEDGNKKTNGFKGADSLLVSKEWIDKNIRKDSLLGQHYPSSTFLLEGDTPSFLNLIPNGLSVPEKPSWGGWGGRYEKRYPKKKEFGVKEPNPIYTNGKDTVLGLDKKVHTSPQATIWRFREDFQNDFAARMDWTREKSLGCLPPEVPLEPTVVHVIPHQVKRLTISASHPNNIPLRYDWFFYPEATGLTFDALRGIRLEASGNVAQVIFESPVSCLHLLVKVTSLGKIPISRYHRFILEVEDE